MHYYKPDEYGHYIQNWAIAEDARGMIYVANNDGVMEFDGASWRLIKLTDDDITISVASDSSGRIYAGGVKEIGYLALDDSGRMAFRRITHLLPDSLRDFSYVWSIQIIDKYVYYQSVKQIIRWDIRTNEIKVFGPGDFQFGIKHGSSYYVRNRGVGLMRIEGDELKLVPNGEFFADQPFMFMVPFESGRSVVTSGNGLMLYDGKRFLPFANEAEAYLKQHQPLNACVIDSGLIAIATATGGVVVIDSQGRWRQLFDKSTGLLSNDINSVFRSRSGGLWVATQYGLAYIDYPSPLTWIPTFDLQAQSIVRYRGQLMMGCVQGLRALKPRIRMPAQADDVPGSPSIIWNLLAVGNQLLVGSENGFSLHGEAYYGQLSEDPSIHAIKLEGTDRVVAAGTESIYLLELKLGHWVIADTLPILGNEVYHLIEHPKGVVWAGTRDGFVTKYDLRKPGKPAAVQYDTTRIPQINGSLVQDIRFLADGNDLLVYTSLGLLQYDPRSDRFVPDDRFGSRFTSGRWGIFAIEADRWWSGRYWIAAYTTQTTEYRILRATRTRSGIYEIDPSRLGILGRIKVMSLFSEPDGVLWVGTDKGLVRYDQKLESGFEKPFPALVRSVRAGNKQLFWGSLMNADSIPVIDREDPQPFRIAYRDNTIRFEYASLFYLQPALTEYQHRLLGFEEEWSPWSRELFKEYTNLPEGDYTFEVRARNVYGVVSAVATQRLVILPPWYRTWWAYSLFVLAFTGLIYGVFRWRLQALAEANRILEYKVEERTAEVVRQSQQLELQNQEIVRQKEEIEHQNQEITDSIKYASRIQEAILPSRMAIARAFPHSFVLYKPKDIVSGDFYWFAEEGDWRLIAAVDCTGHGIPGAFMSVLGSSLLNQIVSEKRITDPGTILNRLNDLVRENLHQVDSKSESKDGMDLMLLAFPPEADRVLYCGANNPLYLVRGGELTEFKAHKYPIGGGQYEDRHFETSELPLEDGDVLYIFSDGYADQFGGPNRRKFMYGKFKKYLVQLHQLPMAQQREELDRTIEAWRAESGVEQIDDILVIGLRPRG